MKKPERPDISAATESSSGRSLKPGLKPPELKPELETKLARFEASCYPMVILVSLVCTLLYLSPFTALLMYQRYDIAAGEYWRLFTGNLLHTNIWHLGMNLAGLWVLVLLHHMHYRKLGFTLLFGLLCLLEGIGLYIFYPDLIAYVGLSGMLHGLFTYGALRDITVGIKSGYLLLVGVIVKVGYEQVYGAGAELTQLIGARVATEAHLVGVICGVLVFVVASLYLILRRKLTGKSSSSH